MCVFDLNLLALYAPECDPSRVCAQTYRLLNALIFSGWHSSKAFSVDDMVEPHGSKHRCLGYARKQSSRGHACEAAARFGGLSRARLLAGTPCPRTTLCCS